MDSNRLLSIFFLLGKSPKDWDFMEDDWEDEYQDSCGLSWSEFITLKEFGWWKLHGQVIDLFTSSFLIFSSTEEVQEAFNAISGDSEDWNDLMEFLLSSDDFEDLWENSWLTRDNMENSLQDLMVENSDVNLRIIDFKKSLKGWFDSDLKVSFRGNVLQMLTPLALTIEEMRF